MMEINEATLNRLKVLARRSRSMIKKLRRTYVSPFAYKTLEVGPPRKPMLHLLRKADFAVKGTVRK